MKVKKHQFSSLFFVMFIVSMLAGCTTLQNTYNSMKETIVGDGTPKAANVGECDALSAQLKKDNAGNSKYRDVMREAGCAEYLK